MKKSRFFTNISLYLRNDRLYGHSCNVQVGQEIMRFLPRDICIAWSLLTSSGAVRLSVCLFVTLVYCIVTAKINRQTFSTLVAPYERHRGTPTGSSPTGALNEEWHQECRDFLPISRYISETMKIWT